MDSELPEANRLTLDALMKILTSTAKRLIRKARITRSKRNARRINTWAGPRGPSHPIPVLHFNVEETNRLNHVQAVFV